MEEKLDDPGKVCKGQSQTPQNRRGRQKKMNLTKMTWKKLPERYVPNQNRASSRKTRMRQQWVEAAVWGKEDAHFPPHASGEHSSNAQEEHSNAAPSRTVLSYSSVKKAKGINYEVGIYILERRVLGDRVETF